MRLHKPHWIGIIFASIMVVVDMIFFWGEPIFYFLVAIATVIVSLPFVVSIVIEGNVQREKAERFLEFSRNLAEGVKTGTPIGQSIMNMRKKNFGSLTPHIKKLSNQIYLGIPISKAFETFASDINSPQIMRAITMIREAEKAGGKIEHILDSVAKSMYQVDKLQKERRAAIYNLVVQGYIIYFIFIGIMLVMQFKILPLTAGITPIGSVSATVSSGLPADAVVGAADSAEKLARPFLFLLLVQGIFTGFTIGKLSEGRIKAGIKHSFVLSITAFLISSGARAFL